MRLFLIEKCGCTDIFCGKNSLRQEPLKAFLPISSSEAKGGLDLAKYCGFVDKKLSISIFLIQDSLMSVSYFVRDLSSAAFHSSLG